MITGRTLLLLGLAGPNTGADWRENLSVFALPLSIASWETDFGNFLTVFLCHRLGSAGLQGNAKTGLRGGKSSLR